MFADQNLFRFHYWAAWSNRLLKQSICSIKTGVNDRTNFIFVFEKKSLKIFLARLKKNLYHFSRFKDKTCDMTHSKAGILSRIVSEKTSQCLLCFKVTSDKNKASSEWALHLWSTTIVIRCKHFLNIISDNFKMRSVNICHSEILIIS